MIPMEIKVGLKILALLCSGSPKPLIVRVKMEYFGGEYNLIQIRNKIG
jgi:hypothetical protein